MRSVSLYQCLLVCTYNELGITILFEESDTNIHVLCIHVMMDSDMQ